MKITHLVTGPLSVNTWIIPLDSLRMMVVDPGGDADSIIAHLAGRESVPALIVLTHGHFDHLIALPALKRAFPAVDIAMHAADGLFLGPGALARHHDFFTDLGAGSMIRRYREELPAATIELADGKEIVLADGTVLSDWQVLHTPGHSPGSVCLYSKTQKTLVSGDTLFNSGFGRTDAAGGSMTELEASLSRLFALPADTLVLPGHGSSTTIGQERY